MAGPRWQDIGGRASVAGPYGQDLGGRTSLAESRVDSTQSPRLDAKSRSKPINSYASINGQITDQARGDKAQICPTMFVTTPAQCPDIRTQTSPEATTSLPPIRYAEPELNHSIHLTTHPNHPSGQAPSRGSQTGKAKHLQEWLAQQTRRGPSGKRAQYAQGDPARPIPAERVSRTDGRTHKRRQIPSSSRFKRQHNG